MIDKHVFAKFEYFGLGDYIIKTGKKISCKNMPFDRYTADDVNASYVHFKKKLNDKEFKKIIWNSAQHLNNSADDDFRAEFNQTNIQQNINQSIDQSKQDIIQNVTNEVISEITNNLHEEHTDAETIILNQLELSNSYTEQNITELEQHLQQFNQSNFITKNEIKNLETKIIQNNEVHLREIKEKIKDQINFLDKFINS